jgi:hypothetical protein
MKIGEEIMMWGVRGKKILIPQENFTFEQLPFLLYIWDVPFLNLDSNSGCPD